MLPKERPSGFGGDGADDSTLGAPASDNMRDIPMRDDAPEKLEAGLRFYRSQEYISGANSGLTKTNDKESPSRNDASDGGSASIQDYSPAKTSPPIVPAANSTGAIRGGDMMDRPSPPPNLAGAAAKSTTATAANSRKTAAASFDWNFDLSQWRNQIAIKADARDKAARAQKRKAQDTTQSRLGDLGLGAVVSP